MALFSIEWEGRGLETIVSIVWKFSIFIVLIVSKAVTRGRRH